MDIPAPLCTNLPHRPAACGPRLRRPGLHRYRRRSA